MRRGGRGARCRSVIAPGPVSGSRAQGAGEWRVVVAPVALLPRRRAGGGGGTCGPPCPCLTARDDGEGVEWPYTRRRWGGGGDRPPPPQTKVIIAGQNEICRWESPVGPFLIFGTHTFGSQTPAPPSSTTSRGGGGGATDVFDECACVRALPRPASPERQWPPPALPLGG